jgi:hypothetical protein
MVNCLFLIVLAPWLIQGFAACEPKMNETTLVVNVILDTSAGGTLKSDLVKVNLVNAGASPVRVAARLSIGYQDSDSREIYAVIRDRTTGEIVGKRSRLYQRESLHPSRVRDLEPGRKISAEFHLREWYEIPEGDLEIQIVYDPAEAAKRFPEIQARRFASPFVPFSR